MHNKYLLSNALGRPRFADEAIDYLIKLGVEYLFGMPAESVNSLVHAASRRLEIQVVTTRHETAAALMAVGYAKASGRLGVCFGTAGPGATNLIAGAHEAFLSRVPLLVISGQVAVASIGKESFQEIDSEALFKVCTSSSIQINDSSQIERFARSCVLASHESTACHVAIPGDVLYAPIRKHSRGLCFPVVPTPSVASKEEIGAVAKFVKSDDLTIVLSCADTGSVGLAEELRSQLQCAMQVVGANAGPGDTGMITTRDVLVVGRYSPALRQRVHCHANTLELTDRPFTAKFMPSRQQIVCDVDATLQTVLDVLRTRPSPPTVNAECQEAPAAYRVFTDLDEITTVLPRHVLAQTREIHRSRAGVAGAALPLAIGSALAPGHTCAAVVVTDHLHLSQFVADLSSLVSINGHVVVVCLVDSCDQGLVKRLGAAMSLKTWFAETIEDLPALLRRAIADQTPTIVALTRSSSTITGDPSCVQPAERGLVEHLAASLAAPIQISSFSCAAAAFSAVAQISANAQAPSMKASALRKSGSASAATVAASQSELLLQLNGIYDAALDRAGIVVVTVEKATWDLDTSRLLEGVAALRFTVDDPSTAAAVVRQACIASSGPGVVHLRVLGRALEAEWGDDSSTAGGAAPVAPKVAAPGPDEASVSAAAAALLNAHRVSIVAGRGAAGCSNLLVELSRMLACRVHVTMGGDSVIDDPGLRRHGRIGGSGDQRAYHDVARADVLLMIGVSNRGLAFDLGSTGRSIVINRDPQAMLHLGVHDVGVLGDAKLALEKIFDAVQAGAARSAGNARPLAAHHTSATVSRVISRLMLRRADLAPLRASHLTQEINAALCRFEGAAAVCADVGVNTLWVYRYVTSMTRSVWSASFGTMGFAIPAAIAVAKNCTDIKLVIAIAGDGGTAVTLSEIESSIGTPTPVVFVVVNNGALAAIKFESEIMGWPDRASMLPDIDFAQYAASVGVPSRRVDTLRDFRTAFATAIHGPGPYLIDARCIVNDAPVQAGPKNWRQVAGLVVAWLQEGSTAVGTSREVVRSVVGGKLLEIGSRT